MGDAKTGEANVDVATPLLTAAVIGAHGVGDGTGGGVDNEGGLLTGAQADSHNRLTAIASAIAGLILMLSLPRLGLVQLYHT
jgi:hypothetical protein